MSRETALLRAIVSLIREEFRDGRQVPILERIVLALPERRRKLTGAIMPNYELKNDSIDTIPILAQTTAGTFESLPPGDTFTIANSSPTELNAVIGADSAGVPALVINALVPLASGISLTVTDADGLNSVTQLVDIVADIKPDTLVLDVADVVHASQAVPLAALPPPAAA